MQSLQLIRALAHVVSGGTKAFVIKRCEERGHHRQRHKTLFCYLIELEKERWLQPLKLSLELNTVAYIGCKRTQRKDKTQKQYYLLAKKEQTFIPPFVGMLGCWPV